MPFGFGKKGDSSANAEAASGAAGPAGVTFEGLTEDWRLGGILLVEGRLSDALNKREAIAMSDVWWAPADGSGPPEPAPGLRSIDPYDLIIVLAGPTSLPPLTEEERAAHRIHKVSYDVELEAPPFRVQGVVHLFPGWEPERLLEGGTRGGKDMFVPVTDALAYHGDRLVSQGGVDVILVNRFYLRGVKQMERGEGAVSSPS
ncbi:MAG TPA: hypothetical protein VJZ72_11395 [Candidatus Limnocylindrales bacterium]|nr:hypothetical protein [Candidatus Limnocylindrales bacterium]